jgi:hypothetical protein
MGTEEQALARSLRTHVDDLAGKSGERNVFRPTALQAAAAYIAHNEKSRAMPSKDSPMKSREFAA